nr:MAG TPA: hypothetical protein [Caudoviricetes sp.]
MSYVCRNYCICVLCRCRTCKFLITIARSDVLSLRVCRIFL